MDDPLMYNICLLVGNKNDSVVEIMGSIGIE